MEYVCRMRTGYFKRIRAVFFCIVLSASALPAQTTAEQKHILVAMRMIGHEVLLLSGDSVSRVLPVEAQDDRYRIRFESEFQFHPDSLLGTIQRIMQNTGIAEHYIVEVQRCATNEVVHSCEIGAPPNPDLRPCGSRTQPRDCYILAISILPPVRHSDYRLYALSLFPPFLLLGLFLYFRRKKDSAAIGEQDNFISVGAYRFDTKGMNLYHGAQKTALSGKESELLLLLLANKNETLERDYILKTVWGGQGDYLGRTLDVFVSKLRKRLEADDSVRIVNIRGIGYRLVDGMAYSAEN